MNKTKTIYKSIIYVSLALLVMAGVILFSSRALADNPSISFGSNEFNVYVDSSKATIAGTISVGENVTVSGLYYSLNQFTNDDLTNATSVPCNDNSFSTDIPIGGGFNPDTNGQTVYFCLKTVDPNDQSNYLYSYNSISVKLLEPSIDANKSTMYIYHDTAHIGLTAAVGQLEDTSNVSLIWSTSELNVGATIPDGFSNVPCTLGTDVYALSIEDLSEFTAENNPKTHGYLYAFKTTDKKVLAKERIDVVTESHDLTCTSNANIEIDLDNPGNFNGVNIPIYFSVDSYDNSSTKIAYTYDEFTDETEAQRVDAIDVSGKSFSVNSNYFSVQVKPQDLSRDAKVVYFYLFKNNNDGKVIFDTAQVSIKRKQLDIDRDDVEFYLKNSNGRTDTLYLGVNENSVNGEFIITNESHEYDRWNTWSWQTEDPNPYRLIVKEIDGSNNLVNDTTWDKESRYGKYNYKNQITLSGFSSLSSAGKDYVAYLEYKVKGTSNYIQVDEYLFYVKPEIPEMIWKDSDINDSNKIKMPVYTENLTANITGYKNGDVIAWTDTDIATADLKDWAQNTAVVYSITDDGWNDKKVDFPVSDLPRTNKETVKFYLIRNIAATNQDDMDVYELGTYQVEYQALVNTYGKLNSSAPILLSERVYGINNVDYYYFSSANADGNFDVTIPGYFKNGMAHDEVIWTDTQMEEADFLAWWSDPDTESLDTMPGTPPGNYTDFYNTYTLNISNITLDEDNPTKTIYLYVRRKDSAGDYMSPQLLGSVIIKEAKKPELTSITSTSQNHNNNLNDLEITYTVEDDNAGIQMIKIYYKENGINQSPEIYTGNGYKLNDSINRTYTLNDVRDDDVTDITIEVYGYNGLVSTYNKVFASKPKLTVEPKGKLESFDRSDYYTASDRNEKFAVTVKNSTESIVTNSTEEAYLTNLYIKVNNTVILDKTYSGTTTKEDKVDLDLADSRIPQAADNIYRVYVKATNSFNNVEESKFDFEVDSDKPQITGFVVGDDAKSAYGNTDSYTYITNKKVETEIKAEDNGSGGLKDIRYYWESTDGSKSNETVVEFNNHPDKANTKTTLDKSFKGFLFANADDMVGNKADKYSTFGGIIVDLPENHNSENHIDISVPDSGSKDKNGNPLYNKATGFTISVKDSFAGIKSVEWKVTSPNDKSANSSGSLNINDGNVGDGWSKNSTDKNIVTSVSKTITVDGNSDGMVLYVKMTDNAGNTSDKSISFSIDKVKPSVTVTYGNQTGDPDFTNYYSDSRTATIVVKERNFNQDSANSIVSNSVGNKGTLSSWKEKVDAANPDNTTYTATITFDKDDRYNLSFQCSDKAGNSSDTVTTQEFVIDKTDPVLSVTFDRLAGINGYYSNTRTATISVKEINFDPGRVVIGGINGQNYTLSNWTRKDNTYSSMISFSKDGEFSFDVTVKDKAGNVGNSVQVSKFTIDQNKPEIIIEGVKDKAAYNGKVAPKITFKDTNIDKDSIKIELIGAINGKVDLTGKYTVSEDGLVFDFKNIENIKENDDLYTLRVTVRDLAGNVTVEEIKFSVNRFGSIYILGDNLKNINDKYVRLVKGLEITEINVNKIKKGSVIITLTVNGVPKTLVEGKDYKVEAVESDGDWKQYKYVFEDSLFGKDGSYILSVVSEDEAGNKNNNGNETKEAEIKFGVDSTAPIIAPVNFEADSYYDANGMDFSISVKDNMILDSVKVYVNNVEVNCTGEDEIYTFHVDESNKRQVIKVVAKDLAGNEAIESYEGILVAGNVLIRFLHNKLAIIIAAGSSSVLVLGGGIFLTIRLIARRR